MSKNKTTKASGMERDKVSENTWGSVQLMDTADLIKMAQGLVDLKRLVKQEIASRGIGKAGKWVGFDTAEKEWGV